ncbi:MAG: metal ABC transporter permease [Candidatus Andersenbacteria bacterium]
MTELLALFSYDFVQRGLAAGVVVALIAPLIGIFLVLRRYSLIADTLAHVSLGGIALGLLLGINPIFTALGVTVISSIGIDRLRVSKKVYGESALALFLSGSLALATVLLSLGNGFNANLFNYLFGSILTVTTRDVYTIALLACLVLIALVLFYKELLFISFDEEAAQVSGIPTRFINSMLIILAALVVSVSIPVVGVLLIAALIVIPVLAALQLKKSFGQTILYAELFSVLSVVLGIVTSFYLNTATGGTIVLIALGIFLFCLLLRRGTKRP